MIRGKYLRERKAIRFKRRIKFLISITIILILYKIIFSSFSLYESEASSDANLDVAYFRLNDEYETKVISLEDMVPGDTRTCRFNISNYTLNGDKEEISETDMEYTLKIRTTTNLPLEYELTKSYDNGEETTIETILDEDGTYFKRILDETGTFTCDQGYTNTYNLKITFPSTCDNIIYQNIIECIEISVEARQIIE